MVLPTVEAVGAKASRRQPRREENEEHLVTPAAEVEGMSPMPEGTTIGAIPAVAGVRFLQGAGGQARPMGLPPAAIRRIRTGKVAVGGAADEIGRRRIPRRIPTKGCPR